MTHSPNGRPVPPRPIAVAGAPPDARLTLRVAALQAAATFASGVVLGSSKPLTSADVLRVAEAFERWLLGPER
jgi:hypothetical protein